VLQPRLNRREHARRDPARALGEFEATLMFAGNFMDTMRTMPLATYVAMERDVDTALVLSSILLFVSFATLLGVKALMGSRL
jgi:molybdate transport system permease protein